MDTYTLCEKLANRGKLTANLLDVYFAAGRITEAQHAELIALVNGEETQESHASTSADTTAIAEQIAGQILHIVKGE